MNLAPVPYGQSFAIAGWASRPSFCCSLWLKASPSSSITEIAPNLSVIQLSSTQLLEKSWEEVKELEKQYLRSPTLKNVYGQELGILPGMDQALALNFLREQDKSGNYDVIIYDGSGDINSLRMLGIPEVGGWYLRRFRQVFSDSEIGRTLSPFFQPIAALVEVLTRLRAAGHRVVLVSSGAVGVGCRRLGIQERPKKIALKQAIAAVGQGRLMRIYDDLFTSLGQPIAQILLTRPELMERTCYVNAYNTFQALFELGVIAIVNENDTVAIDELKFGDNDTLSALVASLIEADWLFILTDVDRLYSADPPGGGPGGAEDTLMARRQDAPCARTAAASSSAIWARSRSGARIRTLSPQLKRCQASSRMPAARNRAMTEPSA